jgi:hypothetical protein
MPMLKGSAVKQLYDDGAAWLAASPLAMIGAETLRGSMIPPRHSHRSRNLSRLGDIDFWQPYVVRDSGASPLKDLGRQPAAGSNPTHPIFFTAMSW